MTDEKKVETVPATPNNDTHAKEGATHGTTPPKK